MRLFFSKIPLQIMRYVRLTLTVKLGVLLVSATLTAQHSRLESATGTEAYRYQRVHSITTDSLGFIWFASLEGIHRFDGMEVKSYRQQPASDAGPNGTGVEAMYQDQQGQLWVRYATGGIDRFDPKTDQFTHFRANTDGTGLAGDAYQSFGTNLAETSDGLWIGTNNGLSLLNSTNELLNFGASHLSELRVRDLLVDKEGAIWIGTENGLNRLDLASEVVLSFYHNAKVSQSLASNRVRKLFQDSNGTLWVTAHHDEGVTAITLGTDGRPTAFGRHYFGVDIAHMVELNGQLIFGGADGGYMLDLQQAGAKPKQLLKEEIRAMKVSGNQVYIATRSAVMSAYLEERDMQVNHRIPVAPDEVVSLMVGGEHTLWIGTESLGLLKVSLQPQPFKRFAVRTAAGDTELFDDQVYALHHDGKQLWLGTREGFAKADIENQRLTYFDIPGVEKSGVSCIEPASDGSLWLGLFNHKMAQYHPKDDQITVFSNEPTEANYLEAWSVRDVKEDKKGNTWVAAFDESLHVRYKGSNTFVRWDASLTEGDKLHKKLNDLCIASDGSIYFATQQGLGKINPLRKGYEMFQYQPQAPQGLSSNYVQFVKEDPRGRLWVATRNGLNHYQPETNSFGVLGLNEGLKSGIVNALEIDYRNNLWVATNQGLSVVDSTFQEVREYSRDQLYDITFHKTSSTQDTRSGHLYFGGDHGVIYFHPDSVDDLKSHSIPQIVGIQVLGTTVEVGDTLGGRMLSQTAPYLQSLTLAHDQTELQFELTAIDYQNTERKSIRFRMEGVDSDWRQASAGQAYYTQLPIGTHTFRVQSSDLTGAWASDERVLEVVVLPPWWRSWWFYLLLIVLMTGIVYLITAVRTRQMRRHRKLLEEEVAKRTRDLEEAYQQISIQSEELVRHDQEKDLFYANVSHEFKTPLSLIISPARQLLKDRKQFSKNQYQLLELIEKNGARLLRLVTQILDMNKIGNEALKLRPSVIDPLEVCENVVSSFEWLAKERGIQLIYTQQKDKVIGEFDLDKLEKIVYNLLHNALKYTPEQGQVVVKGTYSQDAVTTALLLEVSDTGPGIAEADLPHVFKRYFRAQDTAKEHSGTGIGLSLVKHFVALHGGEVSVSSTTSVENPDNHGTNFVIRIPFDPVADDAVHAPVLDERSISKATDLQPVPIWESGGAVPSSDDKPNLLIVEDNAELRAYLHNSLLETFNVSVASDGLEGVAAAREQQPDLIVSDVVMPKADGYELCRQINADESTAHIPVILLTAKDQEDSLRKGMEKGAIDYLVKPFDVDILITKIQNILAGRKEYQRKLKNSVWLEVDAVAKTADDDSFLKETIAVLEKHASNVNLNVGLLAREMGMSRTVFYDRIKRVTDLSITEFIKDYRMKLAAKILREKNLSVTDVAALVGFSDPKYFSKCFKKAYGETPKSFSQKK